MPVILLIVAEDLEVLFQSLVCTFGLTITFRMITGSVVSSHIKSFTKRVEEAGYEFGATVGGDVFRNTVLGKDVNDK